MHAAGKGNVYNAENPGIGKSNTFTFSLDYQGTLIPRPGYSLSQETPPRALRALRVPYYQALYPRGPTAIRDK